MANVFLGPEGILFVTLPILTLVITRPSPPAAILLTLPTKGSDEMNQIPTATTPNKNPLSDLRVNEAQFKLWDDLKP